ncbi:TetR/AcrR family transcriptional regulator [Amycolatopsis sp. 195334CR]|uniref:TetR/AcrR family transcriptional regulator n=1 Tax=Amycolatopsis sp. 195334CR TaxID=2814588 RepID=UPI001A8CDBEF|nr:TetR/AcrR family transcriptional regulator [Amycolatopsis sp. 195334CR]MBN6034223.1 TetR family transcriptional regulator C-terminal domain-containing protein [Amycolatopsis sp. 195334CR]
MERVALLGDAAIEVLAEHGMRGLTHRAVDTAAAVPAGSTSYYARTREALLELALTRMAELDTGDLPEAPDSVAKLTAGFLHAAITTGRTRTLARYEFALEATRRPALREIYDRIGARYRTQLKATMVALGSSDPERHARLMMAWCEGVMFDSLAGTGAADPPSLAELERSSEEVLRGIALAE